MNPVFLFCDDYLDQTDPESLLDSSGEKRLWGTCFVVRLRVTKKCFGAFDLPR